MLEVKATCRWGYPQVILNRPVTASAADLEIFPTLYWLTCPYLCREVAVLESEGRIAQFEERLAQDEHFAQAMDQNHAAYARERLALIPLEVQKRLQQEYPERYQVLAESGIGGIRNPQGVKCLHTHVADYLARGENPIGKETLEILAKPWFCPDAECRRYES